MDVRFGLKWPSSGHLFNTTTSDSSYSYTVIYRLFHSIYAKAFCRPCAKFISLYLKSYLKMLNFLTTLLFLFLPLRYSLHLKLLKLIFFLLSFSMSDPVLLLPFVATITVYHTIRSARLLRVCRGLL